VATLVVVGAQWGDEGKGRITDLLGHHADCVVRFQGGANAGHTVVVDGQEFILHLIPSGVIHPDKMCVIGNGVVIDANILLKEIDELKERGISVDGRLLVSERAHITMPYHRLFDVHREKTKAGIGTTKRGIGPTYMDKSARTGVRVGDLVRVDRLRDLVEQNYEDKAHFLKQFDPRELPSVDELYEHLTELGTRLAPFVGDTAAYLNRAIAEGKNILFEGAQGTGLDIDFGTYPFVTSSNATAGGACTGTGVGPTRIDRVVGIAKAYTTRVGDGPLPTRMEPEMETRVREQGGEFGATTGRPRNCGWFDAVLVRYAAMINGLDALVITKLDVLDTLETIRICTAYRWDGEIIDSFPADLELLYRARPVYEELPGWRVPTSNCRKLSDLPAEARAYLDRIHELTGVPVAIVSVGPSRREAVIIDETLGTYEFQDAPHA